MEPLDHYGALAASYDELWLYSDDFVLALATKIAAALDLQPEDRFVDVGCGTGIYSRAIQEVARLESPVLCADASSEMLEHLPKDDSLTPLAIGAIELFESGVPGDKFLMKEVIHHIEDKQRLFAAVALTLRQGSTMLILLLPPTIEYPLFDAALRRYEQLQPHYQDLVELAGAAGLTAETSLETIPLSIEKSRYLRMVSGRYMSLLSTFSDDELEAGLREMDERYPEGLLEFDDTFVFLRLTA